MKSVVWVSVVVIAFCIGSFWEWGQRDSGRDNGFIQTQKLFISLGEQCSGTSWHKAIAGIALVMKNFKI